MEHFLGLVAMLLAGFSLGLTGGGGSILTVPILVYLYGVRATDATGYSLLIIGVTSLAGAAIQARRGLVNPRYVAAFSIPSLATLYLTRRFAVPALPDEVAAAGHSFELDKVMMMLFAILMTMASAAMIRPRRPDVDAFGIDCQCLMLVTAALGAGVIAGLFGAGGGFVIVPALVLFAHLPMRVATVTSLAIIAVQSLAGFGAVMVAANRPDWGLLSRVTALAIAGMSGGLALSRRLGGAQLRVAFGWLLLAVGVGVMARELIV